MGVNEHKGPKRRLLAHHEVELWAQVTRHVTPMPGRLAPAPIPVAAEAEPLKPPPVPLGLTQPKKHGSQIKPLAPLEQGTLRKLSRGHTDPEAKIDLHGMRQAEAHQRLRGFLHQAHADGLRLALVVTGKGAGAGATFAHDERGVLRRMLPHWLEAADLRHIVLGFTEASRRHGGAGAFYVRLRAANMSRMGRSP